MPQKRPETTADCLNPAVLTPLVIATALNCDSIQLAESVYSSILYYGSSLDDINSWEGGNNGRHYSENTC